MRYELCRQAAHGFPRKAPGKLRKRPPRQINRHLRLRFVHGEEKAVARDAHFRAQGTAQGLTERKPAILDGMMLVDLQIALAGELHCESAVFGELLQHVVEETDARRDLNGRGGVEIH